MSLYRVKQFYWSVTSKIDSNDQEILAKYLDKDEELLLKKLSTYEQKHSVNVARDIINIYRDKNEVNKKLVRAALLHDVGKGLKKLNPFEKSIIVMIDNITKGRLKRLQKYGIIDIYYNHGEKGYKLLKEMGKYDERFLYLVKNHHNKNIIGDKELDLLKKCDCNN